MARSSHEPLRVVGHYLDQALAEEVEVRVTAEGLTLRWRLPPSVPEERAFAWEELNVLTEEARRRRQNPLGQMAGRWTPALRALGQELDGQKVELLLVRSVAGGLQVYGEQPGHPYTQWFAVERLRDWNSTERTRRVTKLLRPGAHAPWPLWLTAWLRSVTSRHD